MLYLVLFWSVGLDEQKVLDGVDPGVKGLDPPVLPLAEDAGGRLVGAGVRLPVDDGFDVFVVAHVFPL